MSRMLEENTKLQEEQRKQNPDFTEIASNSDIQQTKNDPSSNKNALSDLENGPFCRRIHVYRKSVKQYDKERCRRRQTRLLAEKGLTQEQIAEELGVSVRTVKRDWKKVKRYVTGLWNKSLQETEDSWMKEFYQRLEGKTLFQRHRILSAALREEVKKQRMIQEISRKYNRQIIFTINLDNCNHEGIPSVMMSPRHTPIHLREKEFEINFRILKDGTKHEMGGLRLQMS